ncbi:MAG TPA: hypothetical protein VFZ13_08260 [Gemmatimonadales bacterium]
MSTRKTAHAALAGAMVMLALAGCARIKPHVETAAAAGRCQAREDLSRGQSASRVPVPEHPADSIVASTKVAAEIRCTRGLRR